MAIFNRRYPDYYDVDELPAAGQSYTAQDIYVSFSLSNKVNSVYVVFILTITYRVILLFNTVPTSLLPRRNAQNRLCQP